MRFIIALLTLLLISNAANAHEFHKSGITTHHPYAYEVKKGNHETIALMTITNDGADHDHLLSASSPIAENIELVDGDKNLEELEITEHQSVKFSPEHIHLKLTGIKQPIAIGSKKPISLFFETAGEIRAELLFTKANAESRCDDGHQH